MAKPNAASVAMIADKFPNNPSHGFERTTSNIIHVIILEFTARPKQKKHELITNHT